MAVDEILMEAQRLPEAIPTLRFYRWEHPAVTCGYFQDAQALGKKFKDQEVIRRLTGGGLVMHGKDLTFSLTLADTHPFFSAKGGPVSGGRAAKDFYLKVSEALRTGLQPHFPELEYADCRSGLSPRGRLPAGRQGEERICFDQPACYDLLLGRTKAAGSSQRHADGAVLYQSSLFFPQDAGSLTKWILEGFEKSWKVRFEVKELTQEELKSAEQKAKERYASPDWRFLPASFLAKHSAQL